MKKKHRKAYRQQAKKIYAYIKEQSVRCVNTYVLIKRIDICHHLPVFILDGYQLTVATQFAWDEYEIFVVKDKKYIIKFITKMLKKHDKIIWDIAVPKFRSFQFSVIK